MIASVSSVDVRQMIFNDLDAVLEIEQGNTKHAWSKKQFSDALQSIQVLVVDQKVAGFIALITILDQAELQNISIHNDYQLLGLSLIHI